MSRIRGFAKVPSGKKVVITLLVDSVKTLKPLPPIEKRLKQAPFFSLPMGHAAYTIPKVSKLAEDQWEGLLQTRLGLQAFRRGQKEVLRSILSGKDALAVMPTGGGKSLCYQFPALCQKGIVLVISPLIALMRDQVETLRRLSVPAGCLHSEQSPQEKVALFRELKQSPSYLLYLSPERTQKEGFSQWTKNAPIQLIAIDEAHCVSQWGPDFRPDYYKLSQLRALMPQIPIVALTATATPSVLSDIQRTLRLCNPDRHIYGFYRPNLYCQVEPADSPAAKMTWLRQAIAHTPSGRILVYCGTRAQSEEIAQALSADAPAVGFYHAGMGAKERTTAQQRFERGGLRILCATNAFGMGIDLPDIRLVAHYQMPANLESYYQEMGRAGRDGQPSRCLLLYARRDKGLQSFFIQKSVADSATIRRRWRTLEAMTQFAEGGECRHAGILTYFRDTQRLTACGHCDVCAPASVLRIPSPGMATHSAPLARKKKELRAFTELSQHERHLAETLRDWRKQFAKENDIPAFLVFSDKTLSDLAVKSPKTLEELKQVYGFGPKKIERIGERILKAIVRGI